MSICHKTPYEEIASYKMGSGLQPVYSTNHSFMELHGDIVMLKQDGNKHDFHSLELSSPNQEKQTQTITHPAPNLTVGTVRSDRSCSPGHQTLLHPLDCQIVKLVSLMAACFTPLRPTLGTLTSGPLLTL